MIAAGEALGWEPKRLLREVARFVKPSGSGDSDPRGETIRGYERAPDTRCSHKFAAMMLDYLDCAPGPIASQAQLAAARLACQTVLAENQTVRYHQPPRTNPASVQRIDECAGCYLLVRPATTGEALRVELLLLGTDGRRDPNTSASYLSQELACRGRWSLVRDTVSCMMNGYRGHYARPDIANLHLVYEQPPTSGEPALLRGFGVGLTRQSAHPALVPVIAIQMLEHKTLRDLPLGQIGNGGDEAPRRFLAEIAACRIDNLEKLRAILDDSIEQRHGMVSPRIGDLRGRIEQGVGKLSSFVPQRIMDLCIGYQFAVLPRGEGREADNQQRA